MTYEYIPKGVCSRRFLIEVEENGVIGKVAIEGGCDGNLKGIAALACGRTSAEVATILEGIRCGGKQTSCPDQLAQALKKIAQQI